MFSGILKIIEIVLGIIISITLGVVGACSTSCGSIAFMRTVAISTLISTILLYIVFASTLQGKIPCINWPLTDLINAVIDAVLYLISSILVAAYTEYSSSTAAAVFGFFITIAYCGSSWFAYRKFIIERHKSQSAVSHVDTGGNA